MLLKADGVVDYLNVNITAKDFRKGFATGSGIFNLAGNTVKRFIISALSVHISLGTVAGSQIRTSCRILLHVSVEVTVPVLPTWV